MTFISRLFQTCSEILRRLSLKFSLFVSLCVSVVLLCSYVLVVFFVPVFLPFIVIFCPFLFFCVCFSPPYLCSHLVSSCGYFQCLRLSVFFLSLCVCFVCLQYAGIWSAGISLTSLTTKV